MFNLSDISPNAFKVVLSVVFLLIGGTIYASHMANQLYPWVGLGMLCSIVVLLLGWFSENGSYSDSLYLGIVVFIAVGSRLYIYLFPASMIGIDPDSYALVIQKLMEQGSIDVIASWSNFYLNAPIFLIQSAVVGIVSDLTAPLAISIYPLLVGVLFPLTAYILTRRLTDERMPAGARTAASITGIGAISVHFSFWPIAQTLATAIWVVLVLAILRYLIDWDTRFLLLSLLLLTAILFTHQLPSTTIVVSMFVLLTILLIDNGINIIKMKVSDISGRLTGFSSIRSSITVILLIFGILLYMQFSFTGLFSSLLVKFSLLTDSGSTSALYQAPISYTHAVPVGDSLESILVERGHGFVLLPLSGIAWAAIFYARRSTPARFILSVTATTTMFMAASLIEPGIGNLPRHLFLAEPILAVLVAVGFVVVVPSILDKERRSRLRTVSKWLLIFIVITQGISVAATLPDSPGSSRVYLTESEVVAKDFANNYPEGNVTTDFFYSSMYTPEMIRRTAKSNIKRYNQSKLFNGKIAFFNSRYVLIRTQIDIYRGDQGPYRLNWEPEIYLSQKHNKVYSTGHVVLFAKQST